MVEMKGSDPQKPWKSKVASSVDLRSVRPRGLNPYLRDLLRPDEVFPSQNPPPLRPSSFISPQQPWWASSGNGHRRHARVACPRDDMWRETTGSSLKIRIRIPRDFAFRSPESVPSHMTWTRFLGRGSSLSTTHPEQFDGRDSVCIVLDSSSGGRRGTRSARFGTVKM